MHSLKTKTDRVITPYTYQKTSFKLLITALQKYHRALMVMATGLGKTITSILVLLHFLKPKSRVLFLCHDTGILDQAFKEYKEFLRDIYSCTKFYGQKKDWNADTHNIVFATFQSMASHLGDKKKNNIFSRTHFDYIIVDEGHHAKAETYESVLKYFTAKWKMAMTATPDREDEEDITEIFGKPVVNIELPEAIANGWLTPVDYRVLTDGLNEEMIQKLVAEVLVDNVRITEKQINDKIFVKIRTQEQVKEILKESKNKQAIVFCQNITHLRHVAEFLPQSVWVHSHQTSEENKEAFKAFKQKKARHILVVDKFNEGIDIPSVELIVFLRGTDSRRIFLQQLGRGLRKLLGKQKVTILDFVGNIRRIQEIRILVERIQSLVPKSGVKKRKTFIPLHVEGTGFNFEFTNQVANLLKVFDRSQEEFYKTWQEASKAAIKLGIKSGPQYLKLYRKDPRLHVSPYQKYKDFPGFKIFLGGVTIYKTWQEASKAAIKLGIKNSSEYLIQKKYKGDSKLPSEPPTYYKDFPGWEKFLKMHMHRKKIYKTWKKAGLMAKKLGCNSKNEYKEKHSLDSMLPSYPEKFFKDFPGWYIFLDTRKRNDYYSTWEDASEAAIRLGIKSQNDYQQKYKSDGKLPSTPSSKYDNFPGWEKFLGKTK